MIPFYENRLKALRFELINAEDAKKPDEDHIKFIKETIKDVKKKKAEEKKTVKELGIKLYEKWLEIKEIRKKQDYDCSTVDLKVREYDLQGGK